MHSIFQIVYLTCQAKNLTLLGYIAGRYDNISHQMEYDCMSWQYLKISKDMELLERETDLCRECGQGVDIFRAKSIQGHFIIQVVLQALGINYKPWNVLFAYLFVKWNFDCQVRSKI